MSIVLGQRALNRATLARQLLLVRAAMPAATRASSAAIVPVARTP